jgi:hypothetical protein
MFTSLNINTKIEAREVKFSPYFRNSQYINKNGDVRG